MQFDDSHWPQCADSSDVVSQRVERAEYDLSAAAAMLKSGHLLYGAFLCQQAAEKMLKAVARCVIPQIEALPYLPEDFVDCDPRSFEADILRGGKVVFDEAAGSPEAGAKVFFHSSPGTTR